MRELGVKQEEVRLLRYAAKENSAAWEFWSKALHLQGDESVQPARPPAIKKAIRNTIGIKVVLAPANQKTKPSRRAFYGLRYLLVMAGIWIEARSRAAREIVEGPEIF